MIISSFLGGVFATGWMLIPRPRPRIAVYLAARVPYRYRRFSLLCFTLFFLSCSFAFSFWLVLSLVGYLFPEVSPWLL